MDDLRKELQALLPRIIGVGMIAFCVGLSIRHSDVIKALFLIAAPHSSMSLELLMYFLSLWVLIPLIAFIVLFDVYTSEYEGQTLRTLVTLLSRKRMFWMKALSRTIVTMCASFFGLLALLPFSFAGFFALVIWVVCASLFFSALVLCVSFCTKKSAHAVVLGVLVYLVLVGILFTPLSFASPWSFMSTDPRVDFMGYALIVAFVLYGGTYYHFEKRDL